MSTDTIKYHPLIDTNSEGTDKVPMFVTTDEAAIHASHKFYLEEIVSSHYRLKTTEPVADEAVRNLSLHCPKCGHTLSRIANSIDGFKHGLYICERCKGN